MAVAAVGQFHPGTGIKLSADLIIAWVSQLRYKLASVFLFPFLSKHPSHEHPNTISSTDQAVSISSLLLTAAKIRHFWLG